MAVTYGTTTIPSDQITIIEGQTVDISAAFESTVGLVGGMDTSTGLASTGEVIEVNDPSAAASQFGDGSELHEATKLAYANGVSQVFAVAVDETVDETYESGADETSGVLTNTPLFDPNVNTEHSITAVDDSATTIDVNVNYSSPPPTPSGTEVINVNPITGEFTADASDTYTITYDYGDYAAAIDAIVAESPRIVCVLTESEEVASDLAADLGQRADNFDFMHGVVGADPKPSADDTGTWEGNYSDSLDDRRLTVVAPSRGYIDEAETDMERTMSAFAGYIASLPLGDSSTADTLSGMTSLRADMSESNAGDFIDKQVTPLLDYPPITVVKDMTTSQSSKFERVFAMQIVDESTELSHLICRNFIGENNTPENRSQLERSHRNTYRGQLEATPRQLDGFAVSSSVDPSNDNEVNLKIGLDVVNVMDTIDVTITVGDIIRSEAN